MPLRRHPVQRVREAILRDATGAQLVKARTLAERDIANGRLSGDERARAQVWYDALNREIARRVGDDDPRAILGL